MISRADDVSCIQKHDFLNYICANNLHYHGACYVYVLKRIYLTPNTALKNCW